MKIIIECEDEFCSESMIAYLKAIHIADELIKKVSFER